MIREFTKSALSFSWALSLVSIKQATSLVSSQKGGDLITPLTQAAVEQLDETTRGFYRSGDQLQSRAVDMAFSWLNPSAWLNPGAFMRPFTGSCGQPDPGQNQGPSGPMGVNAFTQAAADFGRAVSQATAGVAQSMGVSQPPPANAGPAASPGGAPVSDSADSGWGPMPGDQSS